MCVFETLSSKDLIVMTLYNVNIVDNINSKRSKYKNSNRCIPVKDIKY